MTAISKKGRKQARIHIMHCEDGDFVFGKPWTKCRAKVENKKAPITERLMASTIWWWRTFQPLFPDDLTKETWLKKGLVTTGTNHEWRLLWENSLFFYEVHARLGKNGYLFDKPAIFLTEHEKNLLFIAERHLIDRTPFLDKIKELVIADLNTREGREAAYSAIKDRKSIRSNKARSRKARPWRVLEILDKQILLSYPPNDGERSSLSKIKDEYLRWQVIYTSSFMRGIRKTVPCNKTPPYSVGYRRTNQ